jgi:hypothetical protein
MFGKRQGTRRLAVPMAGVGVLVAVAFLMMASGVGGRGEQRRDRPHGADGRDRTDRRAGRDRSDRPHRGHG